MKLSAAVISGLAAAAIAAPAPASNVAKPGELARRARMNRHARLMHKSQGKRFGGDFGDFGGSDSGYGGSNSGWGPQGSPTGAAGGSAPTGTPSGSYGSSGSGSSGYGGQGSASAAASTPSGGSASFTSSKATAATNTQYNENWAGVVVQGDQGSVTGVSASFALPTVKKPTDGDQVDTTYHAASTWIGIDGYSCGKGLWQAGVDGTIDDSGAVSWYAWYEWYPAETVEIDLGTISEGDVITVNVTASSTTEGTVTMSNAATGKSFTKDMSSSYELCLADAEWIEEDLVVNDSATYGLADFGSVTFTDAVATTKTGTMSPGDDPILMDVQDDKSYALTSSSASGNTVTVEYV